MMSRSLKYLPSIAFNSLQTSVTFLFSFDFDQVCGILLSCSVAAPFNIPTNDPKIGYGFVVMIGNPFGLNGLTYWF